MRYKHRLLLNLVLATLLVSCLLPTGRSQSLEIPLPQPPRPAPVNETRCEVVAEDHVTKSHTVEDGTTPDGVHHSHYVTDAEQEIKFIRCTVVQQDVLVFTTKIPLPQPSTQQERNKLIRRFFDIWLKEGLRGLQKSYGNTTHVLSATSKQP